jgi:hypothetical protein
MKQEHRHAIDYWNHLKNRKTMVLFKAVTSVGISAKPARLTLRSVKLQENLQYYVLLILRIVRLMDNQCSATAERYIRSKAINIQLIPPHSHQPNAAKHTIATFKEHFIATIATVDMLCPLQLWDEFLPQVNLTLNMRHFSWRNPIDLISTRHPWPH